MTERSQERGRGQRSIAWTLVGQQAFLVGRNVFLALGAGVSAWLAWNWIGKDAPIWPEISVYLAGANLPLAAGSFVVAGWLGGRSSRNSTTELENSINQAPDNQSLSVAGLVVVPMILSSTILVIAVVYVLMSGPVGPVLWFEIVSGQALVALGWVGGMVLGRRFPAGFLVPSLLIVLTLVELLSSPDVQALSYDNPNVNAANLAPWTPPSAFESSEVLALRPAFLKAIFLVLVAALLFSAATGSGHVHAATRSKVARTLLVAGVGLTGFFLIRAPEPRLNWQEYTALTVCEDRPSGPQYCALPFYADWIPRWEMTIESASRVAPIDVRRVVQRPANVSTGSDAHLDGDGVVQVGTTWDRAGVGSQYQRFRLALSAGLSAAELPTVYDDIPCSAIGQGRAAYAIWVAIVSVDDGSEIISEAVSNSIDLLSLRFDAMDRDQVGGTMLGRADAELALAIASSFTVEEARGIFGLHQQELTSASVGLAELGSWFGLSTTDIEETARMGSGSCV